MSFLRLLCIGLALLTTACSQETDWRFFEEKDKFTDKVSYKVIIKETKDRAGIYITCQGGRPAFRAIHYLGSNFQTQYGTVLLRFDDAPAITEFWTLSPKLILPSSSLPQYELAEKLRDSKRFLIRATQGKVEAEFEFNVRNGTQVFNRLKSACASQQST